MQRNNPWSPAVRRFLYTIVALILLAAAILFALRLYGNRLAEIALIPSGKFVEQKPLPKNAYRNPAMWFARPGMAAGKDPARWQPAYDETNGAASEPDAGNVAPVPKFAVFFVHPTSFYSSRTWNAPLDDAQSQDTARMMVHAMASAFNPASQIWAPRYRQATFGTFLSDSPAGQQALDLAYEDVRQAFARFVASIGPDMPIVLAGHSQGAYMIERLLRDEIVGTPLQKRIAMVYPIGWPISVKHDLPALGFPACTTPDEGGCIMAWASFAEPADPAMFLHRYKAAPGLDGKPRGTSAILCVNPLTGTVSGRAGKQDDRGTLVPNAKLSSGELVPHAVGARCNGQGLLLIGSPPDLGPYVLPGNNYHVYDIPLFWANLQADVVRRVRAWSKNHS